MDPVIHQPVLLSAVTRLLSVAPGDVYIDFTAGYGGHAKPIIDSLKSEHQAILVDRDQTAIAALKSQFKAARIIHSDFYGAAQKLVQEHVKANAILMDLGLSSAQLASKGRGFSFKSEGPLDMRMDSCQTLTAAEIVNSYNQKDLADLISANSDERYAGRIARAIVSKRPFNSTEKLADLIREVVPPSKIDGATRTFQALRIAVNDELSQIERTLPLLLELLVPGGRVAIISFHSLEDKIVKRFFRSHRTSLKLLTTKPIMGRVEDNQNPRARSAMLRVAVKQ